jgi:hypothetical protein
MHPRSWGEDASSIRADQLARRPTTERRKNKASELVDR